MSVSCCCKSKSGKQCQNKITPEDAKKGIKLCWLHREGDRCAENVCVVNRVAKVAKEENVKFKVNSDGDEVNKQCMNGYNLEKELGKGGFGIVYQSCKIDGDCDYAIKFQKLTSKKTTDAWIKEGSYVRILSENYGVGPKYVGSWVCDKFGLIITEKWDGTLLKKDVVSTAMLNKLIDQINKMHSIGLVHGDILEKNVLVNRDKAGKIRDITLTDFGITNTVDGWKKNESYLKKIYEYHNDRTHSTKFYFSQNHVTMQAVINDPSLLDNGLVWHLAK